MKSEYRELTYWQTGSNGANLSFPQALGVSDVPPACGPIADEGDCAVNSWIIGLVNSMPYISIFLLYVDHNSVHHFRRGVPHVYDHVTPKC